MKIILFDETSGKIYDKVENAENIAVNGDVITWHNGQMTGVKAAISILDEAADETNLDVLKMGMNTDAYKPEEKKMEERVKDLEQALLVVMDLM